MKINNSIVKIKSFIHKESENTILNHLLTVFKVIAFWDFGVVYGNINGNTFTIWNTSWTTSVFYPVLCGEIDENGKVNISTRINPIGKTIYFLFCTMVISLFSAIFIKVSSNFDQYLISSVAILLISAFIFYLGYLGNKVFKSKTIREFSEYLNDVKFC